MLLIIYDISVTKSQTKKDDCSSEKITLCTMVKRDYLSIAI